MMESSKNSYPRKHRNIKRRLSATSWIVTGVAVILSILIGWVILQGQLHGMNLAAQNEGERFLNYLLVSVRTLRDRERKPPREEHEEPPPPFFLEDVKVLQEFVLADETLRNRVMGAALFEADGNPVLSFGTAPITFDPGTLQGIKEEFPSRHYLFNAKRKSLIVLQPFMDFRKIRPPKNESPTHYLYLELSNSEYWMRRSAFFGLFGVGELLILGALLVVRRLVVRNREYQNKLREQEELVVLGSAARALAHEIKNPLGAIALQADILSRLCPEKTQDEIQVIHEEVNRLRRMVNRIGDFLREPTGEPSPLRVETEIRRIIDRTFPTAILEVSTEVPLSQIRMDPDHFRSVFENLLRNAEESLQSKDQKSLEPVRVKVTRQRGWVTIEIRDMGEGLEQKDINRLFDPFYTTKTKGFGIGLSIARRFVEAAGGTLELVPGEGGGTIARVRLPEVIDADSNCR
ncbi:MAG: HAMP domain-containing histidine kinase [Spirochaetales bacterium]|nr:HAMP domain-containing histidine kinase [Spirochaetales bacterium]